jgi:hypothetical protein
MSAGIKGRFRIAARHSIDAKEFTQSKAVEKIIELNSYWDPRFIYVDQGYGSSQIEDLRRYGHAHPETEIVARLKPIDFSSTQEIRDPITKNIVKKAMKPFMVNNAVTMFEKNLILLNRNDREFERQLRNYAIDHLTPQGRPVYSEGDDHALQAFHLAMLAYTIEFTDLGHPRYTSRVIIAGPLGGDPNKLTDPDAPKLIDPSSPNSKAQFSSIKSRDIAKNSHGHSASRFAWRSKAGGKMSKLGITQRERL